MEWKCFTTDIDTYRNDEELKYYSDDIESVISFDNMVHIQWKNSMIPINNLCKAMGDETDILRKYCLNNDVQYPL